MPLGIYISVPFCRTKCSFCNFASDVFSRAAFERYVDRVSADIQNASQTAKEMGGLIERAVDSIYLGGGTPTVLDPAQLERIFESVRSTFDLDRDAEITVECAPGTLSVPLLDSLLRCGVNRVSLGVQSFVDQEAAAVGRLHNRAVVLDDIARLRSSGITNISIDLIAGLPHQTSESWEFSLSETIATGVPHVSVYMLEIDDESRLGRELIAGGSRYHAHFVPDEEAVTEFYLTACERLQSAGIAQYEISNFAREGFVSKHNLKYWTRAPYFGFGVDAHSMLLVSAKSYATPVSHSDREVYTNREGHDFSRADKGRKKEAGFSPGANDIEAVRFAAADSLEKFVRGASLERTEVSRSAALEEELFLGLRLVRGVNLKQLATKFGEPALAEARAAITDLGESGLLERREDVFALTSRGRLLSNEVFERFILAGESVR